MNGSLTCTNLLLSDADQVSILPWSALDLHFVISLCKFRSSLIACELMTVGMLKRWNKAFSARSGLVICSILQLTKPPNFSTYIALETLVLHTLVYTLQDQ